MAGVSLDAASGEDLCLSEPGLFVGLILKNLDVSLGFNNSITGGNKSLVSFPLGEFSSMNLSTGSIEGRVPHPGTSKEPCAGARDGSCSSGVVTSAVGKVTGRGGVMPAREEASSAGGR